MQYRPFGKTGINISTLGFGCMRLPEIQQEDGSWGVDQEKTNEMLRRAYDLGVNYFDTALYYCHSNSEIAVGQALKPIRDKVYISTKCPMDLVKEPGDLRKVLLTSLKKLDTDYVDFYSRYYITVLNEAMPQFPETGGDGTDVYARLGVLLALAAAAAVIYKTKRRREGDASAV